MALTVTNGVSTKKFTGGSKLQASEPEGLAALLRNLLIQAARDKVEATGRVALTDSSGGVAGIVFTAEADDEKITLTTGVIPNQFKSGDGPFQLINTGGGLPGGTAAATDYWLREAGGTDGNDYFLHTSKSGASMRPGAGHQDRVALSTDGTGVQRLQAVGQYDALVGTDLTGLTTGFTIASWDTSVDEVFTAYATLQDRVNQFLRGIGAGTLADGPGTSGGATIASIDVDIAVNTNDTDATNLASANSAVTELLNSQKTLIDSINIARTAVGLARVPRTDVLVGTSDLTDGINSGAAATNGVVTDATTIQTAPLEADAEIILVGLADNVAFLADQLDAVGTQDLEAALVVACDSVFQADTDTAESFFVTAPISGRITNVKGQVGEAITGTTTYTVELGGSAVTGASLAMTGAEGVLTEDAVSGTIAPDTANTNYVTKGDAIEIVSDGTGTGAGSAVITVEITAADETSPALSQYAA